MWAREKVQSCHSTVILFAGCVSSGDFTDIAVDSCNLFFTWKNILDGAKSKEAAVCPHSKDVLSLGGWLQVLKCVFSVVWLADRSSHAKSHNSP